MVETLVQDSADVPPLQPMDSHFIYQAVNLKAPIAPLQRQPATDDAHKPTEVLRLNFLPCNRPPLSITHVLSLPRIN